MKVSWKSQFVQLGGFGHLINTLISLNVSSIDSPLTLKCIESVVDMIVNLNNDIDIQEITKQSLLKSQSSETH